jgi:DNA polymerase I
MRGLIDGDIILYRACSSSEVEVQWDEFNHLLSCNFKKVMDHIETAMDSIQNDLHLDSMWVAFTGSGNFRKDLTPTYKSNRKDVRKPMCYSRAREWMFDIWDCKSVDGLEGDDLLGIWQTRAEPGSTVIVSADKDMRTIPGLIARFSGEKWEASYVSEDGANYCWMMQTLTGDTADGYKGLPGCGPVKAERILLGKTTMEELWEAVVSAYEGAGLTSDDALLQARLARILRASDWDLEKKEVKLWNPVTTSALEQ